ncbi:STAS/SEC14 domain-containing protein [uncultured Pedobacter sp.]|uniref:STAS/SEC14 domain-containing protein n=1 Tax=uncultured Pedobacter sp. TaxID=246139 RepID=UPI0025D13454|nr:STAS/SEC14 domain-containing protein [uncultured Pedobacter sp.]
MRSDSDNTLIEGEIADYLLTDEGILISYSKSILRTVENIKANIELVQKITNNKKVPLLIYLKNSPVPDKETRKFSGEQLPQIYKAMAMVSKPGLAQLIVKILFKFQNPPIPIKSFTDEKKAMEWLRHFL